MYEYEIAPIAEYAKLHLICKKDKNNTISVKCPRLPEVSNVGTKIHIINLNVYVAEMTRLTIATNGLSLNRWKCKFEEETKMTNFRAKPATNQLIKIDNVIFLNVYVSLRLIWALWAFPCT